MNEALISHDGPGHNWLASLGRRGMEPGLERTRALLHRLGQPDAAFASIAVAGTDGKGSTSAMIAALLQEAGLRTGHYTSPHLVETRERVAVDGHCVTAEALDAALHQVEAASTDLDPTPFEALTVAALQCFRDAGVQVAVLEVGLGGRLDAVNATDPVVSVVTHLSHDHTAILGNTLQQIAWEKCGIARDGRTLVAAQLPLVRSALRKYGITPRILALGPDVDLQSYALRGAQWQSAGVLAGPALDGPLDVEVGLAGRHQLENAALAVMAYLGFAEWWQAMAGQALPPPEDVVGALAQVPWPLRAEVLADDPLVVVDAAHNPAGLQTFAQLLAERGRHWQVLLAVRKDRDPVDLVAALAPVTAAFFLPRCQGETLMDAVALSEVVDRVAPAAALAVGAPHKCLDQALQDARRGSGVAITGSQHALGEWLQHGLFRSPRLDARLR